MQKKEIPSIHQEHQVDRNLVEHALDLLEASRTPRDEPVPLKEGLELPEAVSYTHLTLPTNREV